MQQEPEHYYDAYRRIKSDFIQEMGFCNRMEIPDGLVKRLAWFCDTYASLPMPGYYASSLVHQFFRKKNATRWARLLGRLDVLLQRKRFLVEIANHYFFRNDAVSGVDYLPNDVLWTSIWDFPDDYHKANLINRFAGRLSPSGLMEAFTTSWCLTGPVRERSLAGLYPHVSALEQCEIITFLLNQFADGSEEAAFQLKLMLRRLVPLHRRQVLIAVLARADVVEGDVAYLVIRNADVFDADDASLLLEKVRAFRFEYFRIRALTRLARFLPDGEIRGMYERFLAEFAGEAPSVELLHNLYHFSKVDSRLSKSEVITLALNKISTFDHTQCELYAQDKYCQLSFLTPHLGSEHMAHAFAIAADVKGRYKQALLGRLHRHFRGTAPTCSIRYPAICF
jgi:hypothetical protein